MVETRISGIWNIPCLKPIKVKGDLFLDPLKGIINLVVYSSESLGLFNEFDNITGKTAYGSNKTLYKCYVVKEIMHMGSKIKYETFINAKYFFDGVRFKSKNKTLFHEVIFRFSNLDEWAFLEGFKLNSVKNCDFSLIYKRPKQIECKVDDETILTLYCSLYSPLFLIVDKEIKVAQKVYFSVKHIKPKPLEKSLYIIRALMDFVSLCIGEAVSLIEIYGLNPKHCQIYNNKKDKIYREIPIYTIDQTDENYKTIDPRMVLLNLQEIRKIFEFYIKTWLVKRELLKPVIDLYLNTLNYEKMSPELYFLCLVQALESYHRRKRKNYVIEDEEHKARIISIIDSISEEFKVWLKSKLDFSNEPSLRERLDELTHDGNDYWVFFNGNKERQKFMDNVRNTRNYLTHYDKKLENKALKGEELNITCHYLKAMVEYYLLKEIGLPAEYARKKIVDHTNRIRNFSHIKEIVRRGKISKG